jgi:ribonuclease-3
LYQLIRQYFIETRGSYDKLEKSISAKRRAKLNELEENLKINFSNIALLEKSFTHRSYLQARTRSKSVLYNQRLEFLGDAILSSVISEYLFCMYPFLSEGELSKMRAGIVSKKVLCRLAKKLALDTYTRLGKGEKREGAVRSDSILEDMLESLIGAYFLDKGYNDCSKFIIRIFAAEIDEILRTGKIINYKSLLQECIQKRYQVTPVYRVEKTEGPSHRTRFFVAVYFKDDKMGEGSGFSKKEAEIECAHDALKKHFKDVLKKKNGKTINRNS